jgi:hypothetical protein
MNSTATALAFLDSYYCAIPSQQALRSLARQKRVNFPLRQQYSSIYISSTGKPCPGTCDSFDYRNPMAKVAQSTGGIISICIDVIRTFNPVTHSVDTHCTDKLGDVFSQVRHYNA